MTTRNDIKQWFKNAPKGSTHMIVVCDTYDWEDYPSYVKKGEDVREKVNHYATASMSKVMEVYNLKKSWASQSKTDSRVFNY